MTSSGRLMFRLAACRRPLAHGGLMRSRESQAAILAALIGVAAVLAGCGDRTLPPVPEVFEKGIAIFSDVNYGGGSALVTADIADLRKIASKCTEVDTQDDAQFTARSHTWTNCISSVGVSAGWKAVLYAGRDFSGASFEARSSVRDLRRVPGPCQATLNDCVSSIKVFPPARSD
jgi:hypothetical protein